MYLFKRLWVKGFGDATPWQDFKDSIAKWNALTSFWINIFNIWNDSFVIGNLCQSLLGLAGEEDSVEAEINHVHI